MTNTSSILAITVVAMTAFVSGLFVAGGAGRHTPISLIYAPSGEARPLPIDMLRLRPTTW